MRVYIRIKKRKEREGLLAEETPALLQLQELNWTSQNVNSRGTAVAEILLRVKNVLHTCLRCRCLPGCYSPGLEMLKL